MGISSLVLTENNLSQSGSFSASTQTAPYNKLFINLGNASLAGKQICLSKANLYYSWPNINSTNNTFSISFPTASATYTDVSITIPAHTNYASIAELNNYLNTVMIANGMYLINSTTGDYLYWLSLVANPNTYGVSIVQALVPTSLPAGYTAPSGFIGYPVVSRTLKLTTDTSDFNLLIGYAKSTVFNGNTSAITYDSSMSPQLAPVSSVIMTCNLASNPLALNNDPNIMYTFTTKEVLFGSIINVEPYQNIWYDITSNANILILSFTDQNQNPLYIMDPQINILLLISDN
tara:strand:+ start:1857 stop:2729 length:873 start_codon:yes stop_codon:yes gene_type:complete